MTITAKHRPADLWMERHVVVLSAVVADDLETLVSIIGDSRGLFTTTFCTALRGHHIALVEHLLFLFSEKKDLSTLNAWNLKIRHAFPP